MSNPATLAATVAGADAVAGSLSGPHGPRPRVTFSRRNIIIIFMSIELILNAVNLNLIAFSRYLEINREALTAKGLAVNSLSGPVFTVFIIVVAAAEAAVGLGIVIAMFRNRETVAIDEIDLLKW